MKKTSIQSDFLLLLASMIWGFAFVAQRVGMEFVGPFIFNGIRFALGAVAIIPFIYLKKNNNITSNNTIVNKKLLLKGGLLAGLALFAGASFQQIGLVYTKAGNAGFITGLYVIFVPLFGLFWKQKPPKATWAGGILAVIGMYLLSISERFTVFKGDLLVLASAVFWAIHVIIIGQLSPRSNALKLAMVQYLVCAVLSMAIALAFEENTMQGVFDATIPILYGGLFSVGIAYTLQVVAQKKAPPAHAAIILSLEAVFATLGGYLIINETMSLRALLGCGLMLIGVIVSQLYIILSNTKTQIHK